MCDPEQKHGHVKTGTDTEGTKDSGWREGEKREVHSPVVDEA